ncbi:MAG: hypothetical protein ACRC7D_10620 [Aeromonas popoffii]|uniref:hypothetical protein n=1 Tax=Aeromonas popoffii TaxID=70856 RepID=UPI003F34B0B5
MLKHVVGLAEVEATLLGGELAVVNIDPRREVIFGAAQELLEELVEERIILPGEQNGVWRFLSARRLCSLYRRQQRQAG